MIRDLRGKRVLVVGGAGFIGSHLADRLLVSGVNDLAVMDNLFLGKRENLADATRRGAKLFVRDAEDLSALDAVFAEFRPDVVFNCATKALNYSFTDPADAFLTNPKVAVNLLERLRENRYATLCHFSSSEVYGSAVYQPMDEDHPLHPTTTYAAGKAAADLALQSYVRMFDLDAFILRPFNNFGPRQNSKPPLAGIIPLTVRKILRGEAPEIHGDGTQTRDFTFVTDTAALVVEFFAKVPRGDAVHIASAQVRSVQEIIEKISGIMGVPMERVARKPARPSDVAAHFASTKKMETFGSFAFTGFDDGLRATIEWLKADLAGEEKT